jgi:hypothetical protein
VKPLPFSILFLVLLFCSPLSWAQDSAIVLTKKQALEDLTWLKFALEYSHPRLYKYDDKSTVDARFDSIAKRIGNNSSGLDFLSHVSAINASVRCGHLYTIPQGALEQQILSKKVMPFYIKIIDEKLFLFKNCSNHSVSDGSQILFINGRSGEDILKQILPIVAADGFIKTRKYKLIERYFFNSFHGFDLYYYLRIDTGDSYHVKYLDYKTKREQVADFQSISREERRSILRNKYSIDELKWFNTPSPKFEVKEHDNYAILTISRSFHDPKVDPNYVLFLQQAFSQIKRKKIGNLILDLRNNEGGSEHQQSELMSYLYNQPFKLYENIYVSRLDYRPLKPVLNTAEKDTSDLVDKNEDEWMRKISDNLWINNYDYYEGLQFKYPQKDFFTGNIFVLINGVCFSSAAALIANIKNTTGAVFIGEEVGGTYEGPTGGATVPIILPNSKIMVRISPNINIGYMNKKHPIGRGVLPDYPVKYTIDDVLLNLDLEMEVATNLVRKKSLQNKEKNNHF